MYLLSKYILLDRHKIIMKLTMAKLETTIDYLVASDFDQTYSFNDLGAELA